MMTSYVTRDSEGNRVTVRLYSCGEYESDGGIYFDGGNGGGPAVPIEGNPWDEDGEVRREFADELRTLARTVFVCAATVDPASEGDDGEVGDRLLGLQGWQDTATGYILLPDWPEDAPLQARMVESRA